MRSYWIEVASRAFTSSLDAIGQTKGALAFAFWLAALSTGLIWHRKGLSAMKADIVRTALEVFAVAVCAWLPFFVWQLMRSPQLMHQEQARRASEAEKALDDARRAYGAANFPKFEVSIRQLTVGTLAMSFDSGKTLSDMAYAAPVVQILNTGQPSVVRGLRFVVKDGERIIKEGLLATPPETLTVTDASGRSMVIPFGEPLHETATLRAIEKGSVAIGRLFFVFRDTALPTINHAGLSYEIAIRDAWYPSTPEHTDTIQWQVADEIIKAPPGQGIKAKMLPPEDAKPEPKP